MEKKKAIKAAAAAIGIGAAAELGIIGYFFNRTMKRKNASVDRTIKMAGTDWNQYAPFIKECREKLMALPYEEVSITSYDGLNLCAVYFPCENTEKKRLVIGFHGYTGEGISNNLGISSYFAKNGFSMLFPDARAHGKSDGTYIGFGCLDRIDALDWIKWGIETCGEDVEIWLYGVSMGGSTVLMTSGLDLPKQVKGIISDCAFTSPKDVFTHVLNNMYHLPAFPIIQGADILNKRFAGYGIDECNALREIEKNTLPILFIHGDKDTFVPVEMCDKLYELCPSPKHKLIVKDAAHAESYYKDTENYEKALDSFFAETEG